MSQNQTITIPVLTPENVVFKSHAITLVVEGERVECHTRQPHNEPALRIKGRWYVIKYKDLAAAIIERINNEKKEGE